MKHPLPTPDRLRELFSYRDGMLYFLTDHRDSRGRLRASAGDPIPTRPAGRDGAYLYVSLDGASFGLHRLIFAWHEGFYPEQVDHDDRNKRNNRIENLKESAQGPNQWNRGVTRVSKTGVKNVFPSKSGGFFAKVAHNKKQYYRGGFATVEAAAIVAREIEEALR